MSVWDGDYQARVMDDLGLWDRNLVRMVVRRRQGDTTAYLMSNGTWVQFSEGAAMPPDDEVGILLPRDAVAAFVAAIEEWQGHTNHADTEARVLREWLTVERDRVDRALNPSTSA